VPWRLPAGLKRGESAADAARDCRTALDRMLDLHGASGFATANAVEAAGTALAVTT
jgi:hypothetical protein